MATVHERIIIGQCTVYMRRSMLQLVQVCEQLDTASKAATDERIFLIQGRLRPLSLHLHLHRPCSSLSWPGLLIIAARKNFNRLKC